MGGLAALFAAVVVRAQLLWVGVPDVMVMGRRSLQRGRRVLPAQTRRQREIPAARLALELEADVEHRVRFLRDLAAALALDVTLQEAGERRVDDADALQGRRSARRRVDVVQRGDEELVGILLGVSGQLRGRAPRLREKLDRTSTLR